MKELRDLKDLTIHDVQPMIDDLCVTNRLQGHLARKKQPPPYDDHRAPGIAIL